MKIVTKIKLYFAIRKAKKELSRRINLDIEKLFSNLTGFDLILKNKKD